MAEQPLKITLRYDGSDVATGTMPIAEVVSALQGFSGAYGKVANQLLPSSSHELRVSAIDNGSFDLAILAWVTSDQAKETFEIIKTVGGAARYVFGIVGKVIDAKKHTKSKPYQVSVEGSNNTVVVINADGATMPIPAEAIEILRSKLVDSELAKIASPLHPDTIDLAEIIGTDEEGTLETSISSAEKSYFVAEPTEETSKETEISGTLISLNKETLRGTFKRTDGLKVPYRYIGKIPEAFYSNFSHRGPIRVSCIAFFDENLVLKRLEIEGVIRLQTELNLLTGSEVSPAPE